MLFSNSNIYANDNTQSIKNQIAQTKDSKEKVDLLHRLFSLYFTNAQDTKKSTYEAEAEKTQFDAIEKCKKLGYKKGEYLAYKNLYEFYKFFGNTAKRIKYEIKYKKKKLEQYIIDDKIVLEKKRQQQKLESIRKAKQAEIEKDKDANKALIEAKRLELEAANSMLNKSFTIIEKTKYK